MKRGEIYFIDLDPVVGREQSGRRPCLVVSTDELNRRPLVVTVVPGTDGSNVRRTYPSNVRVASADSGLPKETVFLCHQIRAVDHGRLTGPPDGSLAEERIREVETALLYCLGFE
jgi:mRNA interferase MazF